MGKDITDIREHENYVSSKIWALFRNGVHIGNVYSFRKKGFKTWTACIHVFLMLDDGQLTMNYDTCAWNTLATGHDWETPIITLLTKAGIKVDTAHGEHAIDVIKKLGYQTVQVCG
jgi:hypothetical protein